MIAYKTMNEDLDMSTKYYKKNVYIKNFDSCFWTFQRNGQKAAGYEFTNKT